MLAEMGTSLGPHWTYSVERCANSHREWMAEHMGEGQGNQNWRPVSCLSEGSSNVEDLRK